MFTWNINVFKRLAFLTVYKFLFECLKMTYVKRINKVIKEHRLKKTVLFRHKERMFF